MGKVMSVESKVSLPELVTVNEFIQYLMTLDLTSTLKINPKITPGNITLLGICFLKFEKCKDDEIPQYLSLDTSYKAITIADLIGSLEPWLKLNPNSIMIVEENYQLTLPFRLDMNDPLPYCKLDLTMNPRINKLINMDYLKERISEFNIDDAVRSLSNEFRDIYFPVVYYIIDGEFYIEPDLFKKLPILEAVKDRVNDLFNLHEYENFTLKLCRYDMDTMIRNFSNPADIVDRLLSSDKRNLHGGLNYLNEFGLLR